MNWSELFDGEENWLETTDWVVPYLDPGEPVELAVQVPPLDALESPEINYAPTPNKQMELAWAVEYGWSALAVNLTKLGELLTPPGEKNLLEVEELVGRDPKTWKVTSKDFRVQWVGEDIPEGL